MDQAVELAIDSIAAGGDGVARHDGMVVFVPRAAPGDRLRARIQSEGRLGRGRIESILVAGPDRIAPRCHHFVADRCGGCQLQHLAYDAQLRAKRGIVDDAMERIARSTARVGEVHPSASPWAYRSKLTLTIRERAGRRARVIGLRRYDNPDHVFELTECPITTPAVVDAFHEVGAARGLLPSARTLSAAIRADGEDLVFILNGGVVWADAHEFVARCPSLAVVRWHPHGGGIRTVSDRRSGGAPAAAFRQVNPAVAAALQSRVVACAMAHAPASAIDAYAGSGDTTLALHERGVRVTAIELDREAAAYAASRVAAPSVVIAARVEDVLPSHPPADVVVLNPPRQGVDAVVTRALEERSPSTRAVLYVSCNPATLARDIQRLPSYRVASLAAFDMFPQTAHVEVFCELVPVLP